MYGRSVADPDGHIWEIMWMDPAAAEQRRRSASRKPSQPPFEGSETMPINPNAAIEITAFRWVPEFAQGVVRDLRARWALEEAGLDYRVRLLDQQRPPEYLQGAAVRPGAGASATATSESSRAARSSNISASKSEALLPRDPQGKYRAIQWTYAALNSVEPRDPQRRS